MEEIRDFSWNYFWMHSRILQSRNLSFGDNCTFSSEHGKLQYVYIYIFSFVVTGGGFIWENCFLN